MENRVEFTIDRLQGELSVSLFEAKKLIPDPSNVRLHDNRNHETILRSIQRFGIRKPIVAHADTHIVYAGNETLRCCLELGIEQIPVAWIPKATPESLCKAYAIADNRTNDLSEFDVGALDELIKELKDADVDIEDTGFDGDELDELIERMQGEQQVKEDDFDSGVDVAVEPVSQLGDLWHLGTHKLLCGDCVEHATLEKLGVPPEVSVITDPPYGIGIVGARGSIGGGSQNIPSNIYRPIHGDDSTDAARGAYLLLREWGITDYVIFGGNYFTDFLPASRCWIVWDTMRGDNDFADFEMAWCSADKPARLYRYLWSGMRRQGDRKSEGIHRVHPTQKPVGLIAQIITDFTASEQPIFDGFLGSGTKLIAAEQTNRRCYAAEIDPHYVDVTVRRYVEFTDGLNPVFVERDGQQISYDDLFGGD